MGRPKVHRNGCELIPSTSDPTKYAQEWLAVISFDYRIEGGPELRDVVTADIAMLRLGRRPTEIQTRPLIYGVRN